MMMWTLMVGLLMGVISMRVMVVFSTIHAVQMPCILMFSPFSCQIAASVDLLLVSPSCKLCHLFLFYLFRMDERKNNIPIATNTEIFVKYNNTRFVRPKDHSIGGGLLSHQCLCDSFVCVGHLARSFCNGLYKGNPLMALFYCFPRRNKAEMPNMLGDVAHIDIKIDLKYVCVLLSVCSY